MNNSLITRAFEFAEQAHAGQTRKWTDEPYLNHPARVAKLVETASPWPHREPELVAAAWLHDTIEDCGVTFAELQGIFGFRVAHLVLELTEFSVLDDGDRPTRKALDRRYLSRCSAGAHTVKLADMVDNTRDISRNGPEKFARIYLAEKRLMLPHLCRGSAALYTLAWDTLETAEAMMPAVAA